MSQETSLTLPRVSVPSLDRLEVRVDSPVPPSADELIERLYERLRSSAVRRKRNADESVQSGDDVVCDLVVTVDGDIVAGGVKRRTTLEMRDYPMLAGLVEAVVGTSPHTQTRFKTVLPQRYPVKSLAGREAEIFVSVHEVYQVEQPAMEDSAALRAAGLGDSLAEAMRSVAEEIDQEQGEELLTRATQAVLAEFGRRVRADIDDELIDSELLRVWEENHEEVLQHAGFDDEFIEDAWLDYVNDPGLRSEAELRLKTDAGLRALVEQEELVPDPEDMENLLEGTASTLGLDIATARTKFRGEYDSTSDLVRSAAHLQAVGFLMARASVLVDE